MADDNLNSEGEKFYYNHFGRFHWIKHIVVRVLDTVKARFRNKALAVLLTVSYVFNVSSIILGTYQIKSVC